ncbi:hypothetical protein BHE74_00024121, partial [Ensete ventricosum]
MVRVVHTPHLAVPLIGAVSAPLSPAEGRYQPGYSEGEEKGEPRDPTSLSLDDPDPPLPSLARRHKCTSSSCPRRLRGGDEVASSRSSLRLRRRGEEAGR